MDLSVLIAARNEIYLQKTVDSVLAAIEADTEIIIICDGYVPTPPINSNPRVVLLYHPEARGQRQSINEAAKIARGRFLMKLDAHCSVGQGFDRVLIEDWQPGWTLVPRMMNLDIQTWEPKKHKITDYMYIGWNEKGELRSLYYTGKEYREQHRKPAQIDETMTCMGPCWFLSKEDFWNQDGCDEGHGSWGQQGIEVSLKAWLSGGALMVDKNTWFAHYFRSEFPYEVKGREHEFARNYSKDLWVNNKWEKQVRSFQWLVEKFSPPGWEPQLAIDRQMEVNAIMYQHIHREKNEPRYRGVQIIKMPTDLMNYHKVIWENKPKWVIETGTKFGGSALWFQDQLDLVGEGGKVVTVDVDAKVAERDPRILYIQGNSRDRGIVQQIKDMIGEDSCMVVLDSNHSYHHVQWELHLYSPLVTPGQFLVVEDCYTKDSNLYAPGKARNWFLSRRRGKRFEQTDLDRQFLVGVCVGGFLRRKS